MQSDSDGPPALSNYHAHTEYSACCQDITLARLKEFAAASPCPVAVTDHSMHLVFEPDDPWRLGGADAPELVAALLPKARRRIAGYLEKARADNGHLLVGVELDVLPDGRPVYDEARLPELDFILGAVHALASVRRKEPAADILAEWRAQNRALMALGAQAIAHPFRYLVQNKVPVSQDDVEWIVAEAASRGVALELNSHYVCRELDEAMVHACLAQGVPIAVGTDAHAWRELADFDYHYSVLAACGITTPQQRARVLFDHTA